MVLCLFCHFKWLIVGAVVSVSVAKMHVERTGSVKHAVRASMSITGFVPPMCRDGELFFDGGKL